MPRVTVAILAYDRPEFLGEAIESVLAQTYADFKLVVYDNCSERDLKSVVDRYDDPRVIYHRNEKNIGMFGNAAQSVDLCDTELLAILHDDDRYFPWALERLVEAMERYPEVAIASGSSWHVMGSGDFDRFKDVHDGRVYRKNGEIENEDDLRSIKLIFSGFMLRMPLLREREHNFRPDKGVAADTYFILESYAMGLELFSFNAPLIEYRVHPESCTNSTKYIAWCQTLKNCVELVESSLPDGARATGMRRDMIMTLVILCASSVFSNGSGSRQSLKEFRDHIEKELDLRLGDDEFDEEFYVVILGSIITAVGKGEASIGEYRARVAELKEIGIRVPFMRRLKWFVKYIVWQRWFGRR